MGIQTISAGKDAPNDINVHIEIPQGSNIKYEVDEHGNIIVDRFVATPMTYPLNYGYVPQTKADDGDPVDVLVMAPQPLMPGVVIRCRPVGVLIMEDESGQDEKIIAVPHKKVSTLYEHIQDTEDIPELTRNQIRHFFEHYKDLEEGKWVKVKDWDNAEKAKALIQAGIDNM